MFFLNHEVETSQYNLSDLYDLVEAHVRELRSLGVSSESSIIHEHLHTQISQIVQLTLQSH